MFDASAEGASENFTGTATAYDVFIFKYQGEEAMGARREFSEGKKSIRKIFLFYRRLD